ncbi:MAG: hypothetical protein AB1458_10940 [Bacteroidota bacterium]
MYRTRILTESRLVCRVRTWIGIFMAFLVLSGITAFPLEWELAVLKDHAAELPAPMREWLHSVYAAIKETGTSHPCLFYGTDWLAFAHLVIAVAFVGPLREPVKNIWVIQFGMIACLMVLPLALIAGPLRNIPFFWQLIDCSFGLLGLIPLVIVYRNIKRLERYTKDVSAALASHKSSSL